jgi:hypothetical protein
VCKKLCKMFDGRMWAENDNNGSGFSVHFTIHANGTPEHHASASCSNVSADPFLMHRLTCTCAVPTRVVPHVASAEYVGRKLLMFMGNQTNAQIFKGHLVNAGATVRT